MPPTLPPFRTVGLFGKYGDSAVGPLLLRIAELLEARGLSVRIEAATAELANSPATLSALPMNAIGREIDLAVVVGGDGTMLNVARCMAPIRVPLIGVNLGRLGFLTDIPRYAVTGELRKILDGHYLIEERMLLSAAVMRGNEAVFQSDALNDVVLNKGQLARIMEYETYIDGAFVYSARADGVIVATPTGSTAYALSAGGPILHPQLPALVMVPICPHTLSDRPVAVPADAKIEIRVADTSRQSAHVTYDGQINYAVQEGDQIHVTRAAHPVVLLHPQNRSHYDVLRAKLRWGEKF